MSAPALKRWRVSAAAQGAEPLRYACAGRLLESVAGVTMDVSPVEHLLLSIAGCFALSCRAVVMKRSLPLVAIEVTVTGTKATEGLSRLAQIEVVASFDAVMSGSEAAIVAEEAGALCTVSNSIANAPAISYAAAVKTERQSRSA